MPPQVVRLALLAACLAGLGAAAGAEPVQAEKPADKHVVKHAKKHAAAPAHKHAHASAHAGAHKPSTKVTHAATHTAAHTKPHAAEAPAHHHPASHQPARKLAHDSVRKLAHEPAAQTVHPAARAPALAASPVPTPVVSRPAPPPVPQPLPKPAAANADPNGEGFLNLYVELCVKRIGDIDAFHDKLLRENVPRLQPDSAKLFLSGMAGDAWPVPYQGKMGNFVLVLPAQKNLCMLYARRTDTAAVEQGFAEMVAKAPDPMIATRGPETHAVTRGNGETRTVSTSWAPPGSGRRMQFMLTTTSAPNAQTQAFGSVAIVAGPEAGPGPDKAGASPAGSRTPSGSTAPAPRPRPLP